MNLKNMYRVKQITPAKTYYRDVCRTQSIFLLNFKLDECMNQISPSKCLVHSNHQEMDKQRYVVMDF
ncbi:hypothetical protein [Piscibacillus halophilus]|uniref:Uncharacterized protein n=2 Tax=Piscibacillus halophilus TaxID=571933 RepID=A0A1H9JNL2_9BACI|nr:hypothetical protein [Piscibacillus halophilus]SEQ88215.1 hypothetical protein SAMN05216362_1325 [Piscibacillus halophilus]